MNLTKAWFESRSPHFLNDNNYAYNCNMITTDTGTINLKKYSVDNLADFDLTYKRVENDKTMSWYYEVSLNNKKIGIIKCSFRSSSYDSKYIYEFTPDENIYCIHRATGETLDAIKEQLNNQIKYPIKFIMKFWEG